jgi:putative tryptophan/tyrosine transport system substrate-binding protein
MKRRDFIAGLAGAAAWPVATRGQPATIGFLHSGSPGPAAHLAAAFRDGLATAGFISSQNLAMEYRWAEGRYDQLPRLAKDLAEQHVSVLIAGGGDVSALAAKAATSTTPIVFVGSDDPVRFGLVSALNRPGGNVTGVTLFTSEIEVKKLELLSELVPKARLIGVFINPNNAASPVDEDQLKSAAGVLGRELKFLRIGNESEFEASFASLKAMRIEALLVAHDPYLFSRRNRLIALAARHALPAMYELREFPMAGGLMSYGTNVAEAYRKAGIYAGRLLKGEKPSDLPVQEPTNLELVINLNTAKALGLEIPPTLLARADEAIE